MAGVARRIKSVETSVSVSSQADPLRQYSGVSVRGGKRKALVKKVLARAVYCKPVPPMAAVWEKLCTSLLNPSPCFGAADCRWMLVVQKLRGDAWLSSDGWLSTGVETLHFEAG